jgi:hypothetical protein
MKKSLALGLLIILAVSSLSLTLIPGAHSQVENVKILNYSYYVDSAGFLDVVGEVQNIGTNTVNPVVLTGTATTLEGEQSPSYTRVWVLDLVPQQKAPFYMEFSPPQDTTNWFSDDVGDISLTVAEANATGAYLYPDLTITSSSGGVSHSGNYSGAYVVNGVIQNTGTQAAANLTVVGTFFNSTGAVVGVGYTEYLTPAVLEPSASTSFLVAAFDLNQSEVPAALQIKSYSLLIQVQSPILQGTAPQPTPYTGSGSSGGNQNPTPTQSVTSSGSPSDTSAGNSDNAGSNSQSNNTLIYAAIAVVAIVAVAATFLLLKKRLQN